MFKHFELSTELIEAKWRMYAIIWTNAGILLIGPLGTNFNEILIGIQTFSFRKMHLKICEMASILSRPQCVAHVELSV